MRIKRIGLLALIVMLALVVAPLGTRSVLAETDTTGGVEGLTATASDLAVSETGLYIIQLADPSLASYDGGIDGLDPTTPRATGSRRLDPSTPASQAYLEHLSGKHTEFIAQMKTALGREVEVVFQYLSALNAMAVRVDHVEAQRLMGMPGVRAVFAETLREMDTDEGPIHIGAPAIWNGETLSGDATRGEGIVIGVIDTGINSEHPSFAETDGFAYTHTNPYGSGVFHGWCVANPSFCNDKLIGAYGFNPVAGDPEDVDGHGSHTASTAGGNAHEASFEVGPTDYDIVIQGVAPRANIVAYKVCNPSCPSSATIAAVDSAIQNDMVDVLNYSISGSDSPWTDPVDLAFLDAFNAGIFVSASAGNDGPGASTVAKTGPWNASVGASTINRIIANTVDVTGPTTPGDLQGIAAVPGTGPAIVAEINDDIIWAGDVDAGNVDGCDAFAGGSFSGAIALIVRGACTFSTKVTNATNAGATGVIVYNHVGGPPISMGGLEATTVPAVFIDKTSGDALADYVSNNASPTVRINEETSLIVDDAWEDVMAGFSSRGPSQWELVKPDYVAPGVNILAAYAADGGDPVQYSFLQGTSMSSPHGAGSAALMIALHPTWSPAEIKSALATAADPDVLLKEDGVTPANPFDEGHGLLQLGASAYVGLVFDETGQNYEDADPGNGGDPKTLNQPSMADYECADTCSWTRTVTSVYSGTVTYDTSFTSTSPITMTVSPSQFTLELGETQELEITADVAGLPLGTVVFAQVDLTPAPPRSPSGGNGLSTQHLPVVVIPVEFNPNPEIDVFPTPLESAQTTDSMVTVPLTIANNGGAELVWDLIELDPAAAQLGGVIWEQTVNGASGIISDFYNVLGPNGVYSADDFQLTGSASINLIFAEGFWNLADLDSATAINWFIYEDDGGSPAGNPQDGLNLEVWSHSDLPTGTGIDITGDDILLDVVAATGDTIDLDAGTYWLSVFPDINSPTLDGNTRWNWAQADQQLNQAELIDPGDLFGAGFTDWTPFGNLGLTFFGTAFRLEGTQSACEEGDIPWLSHTPSNGTVDPGDSTEVDVTFDSTGLAAGEYNGTLCVESNDPVNPAIFVPVTLEVVELPEIEVDPASLSFNLPVDSTDDDTLTISNVGVSDLDWEVYEDSSPGEAPLGDWSDDFDGYGTGVGLHGMGGWKGWDNSPAAGAPTTAAQALSSPNSVDISGDADLVHEFDITTGKGVFTTWQYIPSGFSGTTYFILLNTYNDGGPYSWSVEVNFNGATGMLTNGGVSGGSMPFLTDQWVEIRVEFDLGADTQSFYYNNTELYMASWTNEVSASGALALGAVDLFAANASSVYYDDMSLVMAPVSCDAPGDISWLDVSPTSGTTGPSSSDDVTVSVDSTGLNPGTTYEAALCVTSNDPDNPVVTVPVTLTVDSEILIYIPVIFREP